MQKLIVSARSSREVYTSIEQNPFVACHSESIVVWFGAAVLKIAFETLLCTTKWLIAALIHCKLFRRYTLMSIKPFFGGGFKGFTGSLIFIGVAIIKRHSKVQL